MPIQAKLPLLPLPLLSLKLDAPQHGFIVLGRNVQVVQGRIDGFGGDAGFGGRFEGGEEDVCKKKKTSHSQCAISMRSL